MKFRNQTLNLGQNLHNRSFVFLNMLPVLKFQFLSLTLANDSKIF